MIEWVMNNQDDNYAIAFCMYVLVTIFANSIADFWKCKQRFAWSILFWAEYWFSLLFKINENLSTTMVSLRLIFQNSVLWPLCVKEVIWICAKNKKINHCSSELENRKELLTVRRSHNCVLSTKQKVDCSLNVTGMY